MHNVCFQGPIGRSFPSFQHLALTPITALSWSQPHFTMHSTSECHLRNTIKVSYDHSIGGTGMVGVKCACVCVCVGGWVDVLDIYKGRE